jgi:uncharacterized protein (TIGR00369 family)
LLPHKTITLEQINEIGNDSLSDFFEIKAIAIGADFLKMSMPINSRVKQPLGLLHGGALAALAENVASLAGNLAIAPKGYCVGLNINSHHLRSVESGEVIATATPVKIGKNVHLWNVDIHHESGYLCNQSQVTLMVKNGQQK